MLFETITSIIRETSWGRIFTSMRKDSISGNSKSLDLSDFQGNGKWRYFMLRALFYFRKIGRRIRNLDDIRGIVLLEVKIKYWCKFQSSHGKLSKAAFNKTHKSSFMVLLHPVKRLFYASAPIVLIAWKISTGSGFDFLYLCFAGKKVRRV